MRKNGLNIIKKKDSMLAKKGNKMKKKLLIVLDHMDTDMFNVSNQQVTNNFEHSAVGQILNRKIINHPKTGLDTKDCEIDLQFLYTYEVPKRNPYTKAIIKPKADLLHKSTDKLVQHIIKTKPDLIVCYGSWFMNELVKKYKINKSKLELLPIQLGDYSGYISFNPSLKTYNFFGPNETDKVIIENRMINRFLKGGIENTKPQFGKYKLITDFKEVQHIFKDILPKYPVIAVDTETNTLQTYLKGAKAIMLSLSWKEHQGVSIPLEHRKYPDLWTPEQFNAIIQMIKELLDNQQRKVMHNALYDIRMFMDVYGFEHTTNIVDTLMLYYETVCEEQGAQRGLKHLAYKYTNMGGYEDQRDIDIQNYLDQHYQHWFDTEMEKYKNGERKRKPTKTQYEPPLNPVDGSKIDFEWLPFETLYRYASADTDVTLQLYHIFDKNVQKRPQWKKLCYDFYPKIEDTLAYMTHTGYQMSAKSLKDYREHFTNEMQDVIKKIYEVSPEVKEYEQNNLKKLQEREAIKAIPKKKRTPEQEKKFKEYTKLSGKDNNGIEKYKFNPASGVKIGYLLYELLGYKLPPEKDYVKASAVSSKKLSHPEKLTWRDYKTDRINALPYLIKQYNDPVVKLLLTYSKDKKMISGILDSYEALMDNQCRVHPQFLSYGTVSGRLASRNPKLALGL